MCRLSAVIPRTAHRTNLKAVPQLLTGMILENARLSNKDGWGMGLPATGEVYKEMVSATVGMINPEPLEWLWRTYQQNQVMIGHTRLSTTGKGKNEPKNAHPFIRNQFMLAHNGHFTNWEELHKNLDLSEDIVVDSEVALYSLAEVWGDAQTLDLSLIQAGLDTLEGSYALIIGNQYEPDRLYLIVGSNPLNLYANDRFHLVNTDSQLLSFVNQLAWHIGISAGQWQAFTKTELKSNHAYVLDRTELVELGTFVPKVTVRPVTQKTGWGGYQYQTATQTTFSPKPGQSTGQSGVSTGDVPEHLDDTVTFNMINPADAVAEVAALEAFLAKNQLTLDDLTDMLTELPTVVPDSPWSLTKYDLAILQGWYDHLLQMNGSMFAPSLMETRRHAWKSFKDTLRPDENAYSVAVKRFPRMVIPYYLNSTFDLQSLTPKA